MLRLDYESDLLPAQLGDSAAGPVHQPMKGGLPSDDEEAARFSEQVNNRRHTSSVFVTPRFVMLRLDLLPPQLSDSAAGPAHQPMQGGMPSDHEEVLLPWEIIARIVNTVREEFYQFITRMSNSMRTCTEFGGNQEINYSAYTVSLLVSYVFPVLIVVLKSN